MDRHFIAGMYTGSVGFNEFYVYDTCDMMAVPVIPPR